MEKKHKGDRERETEKTGNRFFPPCNFGGKNGVHSQSPVVSLRMSDKRTRRQFSVLSFKRPPDDSLKQIQNPVYTLR